MRAVRNVDAVPVPRPGNRGRPTTEQRRGWAGLAWSKRMRVVGVCVCVCAK